MSAEGDGDQIDGGGFEHTSPAEPGLDGSIIGILQVDGRRAAAQIAREVGVTERVVRRRLAVLQEEEIIQITTVADPFVLGYSALAMLGIRRDGTRGSSELIADIARLDACDYAVAVTGRFDLLVEILCRDTADLLRTIEQQVMTIPGVGRVETFPYLDLRYQEPVWARARAKTAAAGVGREVVRLDDIDRGLIRALSADGRAPFRDLSAKLGVSATQVRARLRRLTSSGAVRVMAIAKPRSLGFETLAWVGIRLAPGVTVDEVANRLAGLRAVAYLIVTVGTFDILAEVVCVDLADLSHLLDEGFRHLGEIARVEALVCLDQHYERLRPLI
ncbi:MAG: Lrp/AsnC family transcriptional regulator [Actinobacteria bacterium]|nr:Lrp/AsnC family transcriptional regulator [Actinomycetota bacterium]